MSFKLNNPPYEDNKVKVYKVPMEEGVLGKANNMASSNEGFSIHINQKVNSTPKYNEVVNHENEHIDQMNRGDLAYDDDKVVWKGKEHSRENMPEGDHDLEWEKEIYDKQQNNSPMAFKLRNGKGSDTPFNNLSGRGLIKSAPTHNKVDYNHDGNKKNDGNNVGETDPPESNKPPENVSKMPYSGTLRAEQQKAEIANAHPNSVEKEVVMKKGDVGYMDDGFHKEMGVKKHTSFYKAPTEELKQKGNDYWSGLSEPERQAIRDKKSRYTVEPIKMDKKQPQPMDTRIPLRPVTSIPEPPLETPNPKTRETVKKKKDIKREALSQYGGTYRDRYGLGKNRVGNRNYSKALTGVFGQKSVMSKSAQDHYDEQLAIRKEKKHANRSNHRFLDRNERMQDQNMNLHTNQNVTRTEETTRYDENGNVID
jgi:hypothetical protein